MWWLLVGCAGGNGSGEDSTAPALDVDVTPRFFAASYPPGTLDCVYKDPSVIDAWLTETLGSVHVQSYEGTDLFVQVIATSDVQDVQDVDDPTPDPAWLDVSFVRGSTEFTPDYSWIDFDLMALGRCDDGQTISRGDHFFDLEVLIAGHSYPIEAVITLE